MNQSKKRKEKKSLLFLDLKVKLSKGKINTDFYTKDADRNQYLRDASFHSTHTKRSIV